MSVVCNSYIIHVPTSATWNIFLLRVWSLLYHRSDNKYSMCTCGGILSTFIMCHSLQVLMKHDVCVPLIMGV